MLPKQIRVLARDKLSFNTSIASCPSSSGLFQNPNKFLILLDTVAPVL